MSPLLVAMLGVLLLPLFVATWRTSLLGLSAQCLLMAAVAYHLDPAPSTPGGWLTLFDLGLVRTLAPLTLFAVLRARKAPARSDVIPPNLLSWTFALAMVLVAFSFAELLVKQPGDQRTLVAVAAAGILLGFLVLSTQSDPLSQMIGALRIENAIALLELGGPRHELPLGIRAGLTLVFVATVAFFRAHLFAFAAPGSAEAEAATVAEGPTL